MSTRFAELTAMARAEDPAFRSVPHMECLDAARTFVRERWDATRHSHQEGESGLNTVRMLTETADTLLRGVFDFALYRASNRRALLSRLSLCALGGYGRSELSPASDIDVSLIYEGPLDEHLENVNAFLVPFLWDVGFEVCYSIRSVEEATELVQRDLKVLTSHLEARLLNGSGTTFSRLKLQLRELLARDAASIYIPAKVHDRYEGLPEDCRDLYTPEPDLKENRGGLRDLHTALWVLMMTYGSLTMDEIVGLDIITAEEHLDIVQAADFIWRLRNELHFHANRQQDTLSFDEQKRVAHEFGYGDGDEEGPNRLMQDYYGAAATLHRFLNIAARLYHQQTATQDKEEPRLTRPGIMAQGGYLYAGYDDPNWFAERPSRLMEVFWECARHQLPLSRQTERRVTDNLHLVNDTFRSNDLVRRFFVAICSRPRRAGFALRQAAAAGLLGQYIPEFAEIQGVIRYEDFHYFPVDEHTLRALEALDQISALSGPVAGCLKKALEDLYDPYILVLAILFHDLGKATGDVHVEEGVKLTKRIGERIGLPEEDTERIAFLVENHLLMTHLSQYRDIDEPDTVESFAKLMKTDGRLRALFLLSYADLTAVGPNVWNEWKGALLMRLYLRAEKVLLGRTEAVGEEFWETPKAKEVAAQLEPEVTLDAEEHLRGLGQRYFAAYGPAHIAAHMKLVQEAQESGLAMRCETVTENQMSEVVVVTRDRAGLFAKIAGAFASQLLDINNAALFTRPDGFVVDCFTVSDASRRRPLTKRQFAAFQRVLRAVLLEDEGIQSYVDQSRRRLFALLQPRIPVATKILFDNASSRTHTVIDVETGDRTGLLYDIARAITNAGLDISTARIVTDARRVRDSFYVTMNGSKIEDEDVQPGIRGRLHDAIHPRTLAESSEGA